MAQGDQDTKRIISLGFEKPKKLEGDIIYVDFKYDRGHEQVSALAYSDQKFTSHTRALAGNRSTNSETYAGTYTGGVESSWHLDFDEFIKDLVDSNNGRVDNQRLIEEGSRLVTKILEARKLLAVNLFYRYKFEEESE